MLTSHSFDKHTNRFTAVFPDGKVVEGQFRLLFTEPENGFLGITVTFIPDNWDDDLYMRQATALSHDILQDVKLSLQYFTPTIATEKIGQPEAKIA